MKILQEKPTEYDEKQRIEYVTWAENHDAGLDAGKYSTMKVSVVIIGAILAVFGLLTLFGYGVFKVVQWIVNLF